MYFILFFLFCWFGVQYSYSTARSRLPPPPTPPTRQLDTLTIPTPDIQAPAGAIGGHFPLHPPYTPALSGPSTSPHARMRQQRTEDQPRWHEVWETNNPL